MDGSCAKTNYIDEGVALQLHLITKLRSDAHRWFLSTGLHLHRRGARRKDDGKVTLQALRRFTDLGTLAERTPIPLYTALVWQVSLKRKLCVVVLVNRKASHTPRYLVLASTELALDGCKLVAFYVARFPIEFLFRARQHFTGLADCQARAAAALDFHFKTALATRNLARAEELRTRTDQLPHICSMASWKQRKFHARLLD